MRDLDAIPNIVTNFLQGMIGLLTNPAAMMRETTNIMTNPAHLVSLGQQLLAGGTKSDWNGQCGGTYLDPNTFGRGHSPNLIRPQDAISYPQLAHGPFEQVLAFNSHEEVLLKEFPQAPYLSAHGVLSDLYNNDLPGSSVLRTFPIEISLLDTAARWPREQALPFDGPPVDATNTTEFGYSKQACFFGDGSSIVTVGPSLPKITVVPPNGIQFWVVSCGIITQATGVYEGARGTAVYSGSTYFPTWPASFDERIRMLIHGFRVTICCYMKLIFKRDRLSGT